MSITSKNIRISISNIFDVMTPPLSKSMTDYFGDSIIHEGIIKYDGKEFDFVAINNIATLYQQLYKNI